MTATQEQLKFKNTFNKFLTDANITDPQKHSDILKLLREATATGLATPDMLGKYNTFRDNRLKKLKEERLTSSAGQPLMKTDVFGKQVQATGQDLFLGGQYRPDLGIQGIQQAKQQQVQQLGQTVGEDVKRLEGARRVLADNSVGGNLSLLGAGLQAIGGGFLSGVRTSSGIAAPTVDELRSQLVRGDLSQLSADTAIQEAVKPAATGGFVFGQGLGATVGGSVGATGGNALLSATTFGASRLAPWLIPLVAAGASFAGGETVNKLSEAAMRNTYGDQYDEVLRVLQQARDESDGAALAGSLGNVLLQGSPVLASGIGGRQVLGAVGKGVFGGQAVRVMGSAEQLGAGAASMALADASVLPQAAASASKFDDLISNFLTKYGATATTAAEKKAAYKVFEPSQPRQLPGAGFLERTGERISTFGKRVGEFSDFARDTPGVSEYLADAIGEQAVNFGQAAADYKRQYDEAKRIGAKPPSTFEALTNLAFGSLFIGNNRFTDAIDTTSRAIGTGALDVAARVPVLEGAIDKMRENYTANQVGVMKAFMDSNNKRAILGKTKTDHEIETGVRSRIGVARPTSAGMSRLAPDEIAYSLGNGNAVIYNKAAGATRIVPHAEVFGGVDDTASVESGTAMANALAGIPTTKAQTGLKGFLNKEADVVQQVGDNKQQVIGPVDTGHVIVRETPPVDGEAGVTPIYSIMRVSDLEAGNQDIAAKLLGESGIEISNEPTTVTADDGSVIQKDLFSVMQEQKFLTEDLAEYDRATATSVKKEFPTLVQFDDGVQLRGRVLGIEANGDIKFQPMALNMMVMRVPGVNVLSGPNGKSTVTKALEPIALKDIVDEVSLSAGMRPKQDAKFNPFIEDADGNHDKGLYSVSVDGDRQALMLTAEQIARLPELRTRVRDAVENARLSTTNRNLIDTARTNALKDARKALFGEDGIPYAANDYGIGSIINVETTDGPQRGIVIDNTSYGPSVILDNGDGKPVVVQESNVISGESTPKPERPATASEASRRVEIPLATDDEGSVFGVATKYRNEQRAVYIMGKIDEMAGESPSTLATEMFGMEMSAGRVIGSTADVGGRYQMMRAALESYGNRTSDPAVKAEVERLGAILYDMRQEVKGLPFISTRDYRNERSAEEKAAREAERAAAGATAISIPTPVGTADNVYQNMSLRPTPQTKAEFVASEIEDIYEKFSTDGVVSPENKQTIITELFGLEVSEKDGIERIVGSESQLDKRYKALAKAIQTYANSTTSSPEFKARSVEVLQKLLALDTAVRSGATYISKSKLDAEIAAASAPAVESDDASVRFSLVTNLIKDLKDVGTPGRKAEFIRSVINDIKTDDGFTMSPAELAEKVFGLKVDDGRVVGTENNIANAYASLKAILDTNAGRARASTAFKADAPALLSALKNMYEAVNALPRITTQELNREKGASGDKAAEAVAEGQEDAIRNSEQARAERRVSVAQAQAIQGLIRSVRNKDGVLVPVVETTRHADGRITTRNIAQAIIKKVASGNTSLLGKEERVAEALGMPPFTDKEWWRNAYQGVMYINDTRGVLRSAVANLVDVAVDQKRNRPGQPLMLDTIGEDVLDRNQRNALEQASFINTDGSIDMSAIVIHGSTERGTMFGVLNQVASNEETLLPRMTSADIMDVALEAVSTVSWGDDTTSTFRTERPKNRSEFEAIVKRLISKSKDRTDAGKKAQAIAELFDTLSHAAVKRRVQLMMEAAEKGYFTTRSAGAERTLSPTRSQRISEVKFDSYLEGELRPLYNQLIAKLKLPPNTDVKTYLTSKGKKKDEKRNQIASALVEIIDTELEKFYEERFPAFANFDAIPDIADTAGMFVQIYDPDKEVAANVVMAFKAADVSTMVHEIAHAFFEALPEDMQADLSSALGHTLRVPTITHASVLTYEAQEKFAYGLEMALANFQVPTDWRGTNAGRKKSGATKALTDVLEGVAEAVRSSYDILTTQGILKTQDGKYSGREWQIPYTGRPVDGNLQNPNGRVYLWKGAPIILHDGTYAKVNQQFGTTRNGQREVEIIRGTNPPEKIRVGEIKAIGGPAEGLNPVTMSVLSNWIGARKANENRNQYYRLGLEDSTPAQRAKYIQRDPKTGRVFVSRKDVGMATGDISNEDIQMLLNAIGLPRVKAIQLQAIRERVGTEELQRLVKAQAKIAREFDRNRPGIIEFEDNALRALTREYASAVLYSRMYDQAQQGNPAAVAGIKGYERPRNYAGRGAFNEAHAAVMEIVFANRQAMESASDQVKAIANNRQNQNWRIKESNGKPMYDPRTGELVIEKIRGAVGRKVVVGEYKVNLKTGVVIIPPGAEPFIAPEQRWIETDVQFPDKVRGGKLTDINQRASDALRRVGLTGGNSFRATSPEFFIARALVEKNKAMFLGEVPAQPPTVLSQVTDVTSLMQRSEPEGIKNERLAVDSDQPVSSLYTEDVVRPTGTSPTLVEKPLHLMSEKEYDDAVMTLPRRETGIGRREVTLPARFLRFGMPDKDPKTGKFIPSTNFIAVDRGLENTKEKGISTYRAWKDPITGKYVIQAVQNFRDTDGETIMAVEQAQKMFADKVKYGGLKIYELTGESVGEKGQDREYLVTPESAKVVTEVNPKDVVFQDSTNRNLLRQELEPDEIPDWSRVRQLPSQYIAVYAANRDGLPVNQDVLAKAKQSEVWKQLEALEGRVFVNLSIANDTDIAQAYKRMTAMDAVMGNTQALETEDGKQQLRNVLLIPISEPAVSTGNPNLQFHIDVTDPVNLGDRNVGVAMPFNSARKLFKTGDAKEYVARLRQIDAVTTNITDDTFSDTKATGGFSLTASIAADDEHPYYSGSITVYKDRFSSVLARAAYMARKMGQPNIHVTSDATGLDYGVTPDGANVVPSLTFSINDNVSDATTLRAFAESMPNVLNGAIYNEKDGTLTVYAVPAEIMGRAEGKEWINNAKDAAREFFFTTDGGAVKEPKYTEGKLKLWNLGSSEFGAQGRFIPYDTVLDIVSTISPIDSVSEKNTTVSDATQKRLRGDIQDALSIVFGKDVKIPADAKFRREFIPPAVQQQMARHYSEMPTDGTDIDPNIIPAYQALVRELDKQYRALKIDIKYMNRTQISRTFDGDEIVTGYNGVYGDDTSLAARDIMKNKRLYIYRVNSADRYGGNRSLAGKHPLSFRSPFRTEADGMMTYYDVLRAVHDAISHSVYAVNYSATGSDMAYVAHAMITQDPMAIWALANETRMQNMWRTANDSLYGENGEPLVVSDVDSAKLEYKFALPVYESIYTGVASVDDKLRAFGTELGDYAGTLSLTAGKGEQTFYGVGNNRSAFADGAVVQIMDPSMKGKAVFDLKNGTVRTSEELPRYRVDDFTPMASTTPSAPTPTPSTPVSAPTSAMGAALATATTRPTTPAAATASVAATVAGTPATPAKPATPAVVVSARPTKQEPGALRFLYMVNQLLKLGASGDASPILMQNFPLANILENPEMFIRQLGLSAQVIFNPNTGFHLKDGRIINAEGMRGRKLFHETLTKEVRNRNTYEMAKNSGLSLAAADADKLLEEARAKDPNATWDNVDDLGYNTDISTDGEFMKHLPGQGQSERFYAMSKDLVKMRQFDDMVHHLIALGYNPTAWTDAEGNYVDSPFNRALKDISHLLNVIAGDIKVHDIDETDESIMRLGKFLLYSPRWLSSRLLLDDFGRFMFKGVAKAFGTKGEAYAKKVLELNGMTPERLKKRDNRVGAMHARLLNKSWLLWLGLLGLIYGVKATNPRTMEVTVDKFGARLKVGDYSFRAPGAIMTHIELSTSIGQAVLEWQAQKGGTTDKPLHTIVGEKLNSVLLSRTSPVVGLAGNIITGRDTQGAPAFVTDEAVEVFWKEVIGPEMERMGVKGLTDMKINKAIAERMLWWWARDAMEMYADQRKFGVTSSEALLKAAGGAAISAQGGRAMYVPKELDFERKKAERLEAPITTGTEIFTGVEATPIVTNFYEPVSGSNYTDEVAQPFFGATGTDFEDESLFPRDLGF